MSVTPGLPTQPRTEHSTVLSHSAAGHSPALEHERVDPPTAAVALEEKNAISFTTSAHSGEKYAITDAAVLAAREEEDIEVQREQRQLRYRKLRPFILTALAIVILAWWISATVLKATRHRWYVIAPSKTAFLSFLPS